MEAKEFFKQAKVGSLVDLRKDLKIGTYGTDSYIKDMPAPGTRGLVIRTLCEDVNKFRLKDCIWNFTPEMVERVYSSEKSDDVYKVGDTVTFRSDLKENKLNKGTNLTFFPEGPIKAGCIATIVEILPDSSGKQTNPVVFKVKGSPYFYDSGMLFKEEKIAKPEASTMKNKERIVQTVIDRIGDTERVFDFLNQKLVAGNVVKIRENAHRSARYWGCCYLPESMLESGRTAKISDWYRPVDSYKTHGNRLYLDKDRAGFVYSVPMFDAVYCITRNPSIYKEFLETFDVDKVTEKESSVKEKSTTECSISAELVRESIKKLQELEKAFEKMLK